MPNPAAPANHFVEIAIENSKETLRHEIGRAIWRELDCLSHQLMELNSAPNSDGKVSIEVLLSYIAGRKCSL